MTKRTRVLFFQSQSYFGADSAIHGLLMRHYDRSRIEVQVACNRGSRHAKSAALTALETIPDLHIVRTDFGPTLTGQSRAHILRSLIDVVPAVISLTKLTFYAKRHHIQLIHGTEKPRDALYGVLLAKVIGAKSIVHLHIKCTDEHSRSVKWAMRHADAIIGVSDWVAQTVVAQGYAANKVYFALNSLDTSRWPVAVDGAAIREEYGLAPDIPLLCIASRLFVWKGHTELLKALARVRQQVPEVRLLIVGEDDPRAQPGHRSYSHELKALIRNLDLVDNVIFAGFRKDVARILAACDIYTMPSFEEPFGMIFLEAMTMGKPIVALNNGGTPEVVEHGKDGLLSAPGDIETLAANILTLIKDPALRRRMGEHGVARVREYFTPQRLAADVEHIYKKVLGDLR